MPPPEILLKAESKRLFQEILRHGMLGLREVDKSKVFRHSEEFYARFRSNREHDHSPPRNSSCCLSKSCYTDKVGKSHRRSRCTLCTLEPKLLPTSQNVNDIPLKVKGHRCREQDPRLVANSPLDPTLFAGVDASFSQGTKPIPSNHNCEAQNECSWTDAGAMTAVSEDERLGVKMTFQTPREPDPPTGLGFLEGFEGTSEWGLDKNEDQGFIAALTLRSKAWHPQRRSPLPPDPAAMADGESKGKERGSQRRNLRERMDLPKQIIAQSHWSNTHSATALMEATMVIRMSSKENVHIPSEPRASRNKIPTLKFPPIATSSQEFFKKLRTGEKKSKPKRTKQKENEGGHVRFPDLKNPTTNVLCETETTTTTNFISNTCRRLLKTPAHPRPAGSSETGKAKSTTRTGVAGKIEKPVDLEKRYPLLTKFEHNLPPPPAAPAPAKKKCEPPFRLPKFRILPTIGSVSIQRDRNLANHKFEEAISGCAVSSITRR